MSLGSDDRLTFAHPSLGIGIKHDIKHVVSVPLKSNGSPLARHVDAVAVFRCDRGHHSQPRLLALKRNVAASARNRAVLAALARVVARVLRRFVALGVRPLQEDMNLVADALGLVAGQAFAPARGKLGLLPLGAFLVLLPGNGVVKNGGKLVRRTEDRGRRFLMTRLRDVLHALLGNDAAAFFHAGADFQARKPRYKFGTDVETVFGVIGAVLGRRGSAH